MAISVPIPIPINIGAPLTGDDDKISFNLLKALMPSVVQLTISGYNFFIILVSGTAIVA